jgi:NAD(P)-dependent dehydrogenase (short-subunit alcohol dehydrogenase family)
VPDPLDFSGQAVVVTGGGRGVGRAITERFLGAGADVVIVSRHAPEDPPAAGGRTASHVVADVRSAEAVQAAVDAVVRAHGRLDVWINNAGGSPPADAATASPRFSAAIVALNLLGPLYCAQAANAIMQRQAGGGVILNIGSVSALRPSPRTAAYGAAKAGLLSLTRSLAVEWAPKVRVNAVSAGMVETEQAHLHYGDAAGVAAVAKTVPMGRLAQPGDVAGACLFLASPLAAYVSGADLLVHGGGEAPAFLARAHDGARADST